MSDRCKTWTPGVPPAGIHGADLDTGTVLNAALAGSITTAKLAGSITNAKLSNPYAIHTLTWNQPTLAAATGIGGFQCYGAAEILEVGAMVGTAPTSGTTSVDVHAGPNVASCVTVLATALSVGLTSLKTRVAAPSGTLGVLADNDIVRVDVDAIGSGTKANLSAWIVIKQYLSA